MTTTNYNHEAVELALYIDNDEQSYCLVQDALATLDKHAGPGYDDGRAIPFMEAVVAQCARRYHSEFGTPADQWYHIFDVPTRRHVAEAIVEDWKDQHQRGER
jgi:hypothetical protein